MILIDQQAERQLTKRLEVLRNQRAQMRCLHIQFPEVLPSDLKRLEVHSTILRSFQVKTSQDNATAYLCADGDVFLLTPMLSAKEAQVILRNVSEYLGQDISHTGACYDVQQQSNLLLYILEQKSKIQETKERTDSQEPLMVSADPLAAIEWNILDTRRQESRQPEIMIVEDDIFSRRLIEGALQKEGKVHSFGTAERAFEQYPRIVPDILFLDINLPDVSGHIFLKRLLEKDQQAYVVMLSGNCDRTNIMQAMNSGAKGFVGKPFTRDKLIWYVKRCPTIQQKEHL